MTNWNKAMKYFCLLLLWLMAGSAVAQEVKFNHDTAVYSNRIRGGEAVANDSLWDDPSDEWDSSLYTKRLFFPFYAMGCNLDTFILEDGNILSTDGNFGVGNFSDLVDKGFGGRAGAKSPISLHRFGSAPNRVVMIQWANHGFYGDFDVRGKCTDSGNMQMWIYESGGKIELRFGKNYIRNFASTLADLTVFGCFAADFSGIRGLTLEGNPNRPTPNTTDIVSSTGLLGYPQENKRYIFTFDQNVSVKRGVKTGDLKLWYNGGRLFMKGNETGTYELFDGAGKCVEIGMVRNGSDLGNTVKNGIYLLKVKTGSGTGVLRISVLH
jgi:hypothetical protein